MLENKKHFPELPDKKDSEKMLLIRLFYLDGRGMDIKK